MARVIQEHIKRPLADELLFGSLADGGHVRVTVGDDNELALSPESPVKELEHLSEKD
jgi:ATP-dependent Clp protease ATP-binding subunit ClpA